MTARLLKITHLVLLLAAVVLSAGACARAAQSPCEEFSRAVKSTYNFKPSRLKDEAERSAKPKTSREEFLKAFNGIVNGEPSYFFELVGKVPDGEKDVVAVLKPEDLPLVRRVRRKFISAANPHATEYYDSFTKILLTFVLRTETLK
jgi:hypothetical protein